MRHRLRCNNRIRTRRDKRGWRRRWGHPYLHACCPGYFKITDDVWLQKWPPFRTERERLYLQTDNTKYQAIAKFGGGLLLRYWMMEFCIFVFLFVLMSYLFLRAWLKCHFETSVLRTNVELWHAMWKGLHAWILAYKEENFSAFGRVNTPVEKGKQCQMQKGWFISYLNDDKVQKMWK